MVCLEERSVLSCDIPDASPPKSLRSYSPPLTSQDTLLSIPHLADNNHGGLCNLKTEVLPKIYRYYKATELKAALSVLPEEQAQKGLLAHFDA